MVAFVFSFGAKLSLSARRAWIEIGAPTKQAGKRAVALRKESVDRNIPRGQLPTTKPPSLSARRAWIEIIDYIIDYATDASLSARRAWIEMFFIRRSVLSASRSLSARRAWIEILISARQVWLTCVALRKESVDRNCEGGVSFEKNHKSLSARRAWIEIANFCRNRFCPTVALRKESVDRNTSCTSMGLP